MEKRPLSLTIIAWFLIITSLFALYSAATMGSNPVAMKMIEQMHMSLRVQQAFSATGAVVNIICAYGILKGMPWSRVLYVVWSVIGIAVGLYISPMKILVALGLLFLVVISFFLFRDAANEWFQARGFMLTREVPPSERR